VGLIGDLLPKTRREPPRTATAVAVTLRRRRALAANRFRVSSLG